VEVEKEVGVEYEEVERRQRSLEAEAEARRLELLSEHETDREAKAKIDEQLATVKAEIRSQRDEQIRAAHRLRELQSKLLVGGENLLEKASAQAEEQRRLEEEREERRRQEQALAAQVEAEEEARLGFDEKYNSLEEEIEGKTRKLKKLWAKFKSAQAEVEDLQNEFAREKEDILETIRELSRQLKLRQLIMTSYIPLEQLSKIERCSEWDEGSEQWRINRLQYAGNKVRSKRKGDAGAGSPMRGRKAAGGAPEGQPLDISKALAAVFFSYEPDPEALAKADAEDQALVQAEAAERAAEREARRKKKQQSALDAALK